MKKFLRCLAVILSAIMLLISLSAAMTGCNNSSGQNGETGSESSSESKNETTAAMTEGNTTEDESNEVTTDATDEGKTEYTVKISTIGGRPIQNLTFYIYNGNDLVDYGQTDENGIGTVTLDTLDGYTVKIPENSLKGYIIEENGYSFSEACANIVLTSAVIEDTSLTGVRYQLGDIMHDFTVIDTEGNSVTLSEVLKEKKGVMLNFWFSTCSPCINEFPYLQSAYEKYSEDIEVIALNNYGADNDITVRDFQASLGLSFTVAKDYSTLGTAFGINSYPTSIFIDRYGTICLIHVGSITSERPFVAAFDHLSADNYTQVLFNNMEELTPAEIPNVDPPTSDEIASALSGNGFSATYYPETDSDDAQYSWPFLTGAVGDRTCVYPSNSFKESSFAILHADVQLKAGEALAIDWFSDTELGVDMLYILVNEKDIYRISGTSTDWTTCYPYVAVEDGTYKVSFIYLKDDTTDAETDRVLLSNFRIVKQDQVNSPTYIPRQAATKPNANGLGYQNYITPAYNEADGYYHVGDKNGPILLVNLMGSTLLSETSLNQLGYDGDLTDTNGNIYETLVTYCNYSINGTLYGFSPVTEELKGLLVRVAYLIGFEPDNENQWLQACSYYDAYGSGGKQLEDPVKGIAFFAAYDTLESTDSEEKFNTVTYDGRVIMPRGLKYKFTPTKSGAYIITSQSNQEVNGWVFNDAYEIIHTASVVDRPFGNKEIDLDNVSMIVYLEAGKDYYIDIAYYDVYAAGTFTFTVKYIAPSYEHFHLASPGYFTYYESTTGQLNETIAGGIEVAIGDDGFYHEKRADGSLGSIVYADFIYSTGLFSHSIDKMITLGGFNFSLSETDQIVLAKLKEYNGDVDACRNYYKELWGDEYDEWQDIYSLEEVLAGKYHGEGEDLTDEISAFLERKLPASDDAPELEGCVPVDAELAKLLQVLMNKYSLSGVRNSWTKLCYYYKIVGSATEN